VAADDTRISSLKSQYDRRHLSTSNKHETSIVTIICNEALHNKSITGKVENNLKKGTLLTYLDRFQIDDFPSSHVAYYSITFHIQCKGEMVHVDNPIDEQYLFVILTGW
jgi:hypothetical protein